MSRHVDENGGFEITSLPGQCQVAICHGFFINEGQRGKGKGKLLKAQQNRALRQLHYNYAICTVSENNAAQIATLKANGWHFLTSFRNNRMAETTEIWGYLP